MILKGIGSFRNEGKEMNEFIEFKKALCMSEADELIVQSLGRDVSYSSIDGTIKAYEYEGVLWILDFAWRKS